MRKVLYLIIIVIAITSCKEDDLLPDDPIEELEEEIIAEEEEENSDVIEEEVVEQGDTTLFFTGKIFDIVYNWVGFTQAVDSLVVGYSRINLGYLTPLSREIDSGIDYNPYCCDSIPENINRRIVIHVVDSSDFDPDDLEDRERLKSLFEIGEKRIGWFGNPLFLPPEVVLKRGEHDLIPSEFEVEYVESINSTLHYYSTKWGPQDQNSILGIIENEGYYTCIDTFDKETGQCDGDRYVTFIIDCKLYDKNGEFATRVTGEFRSGFLIY